MAERGDPVTVGICAHNEEDTIGTLLDQVRTADVPIDDIIVVVAGDDATADIVADHAADDDRIRRIVEEERRGQVAAQNRILDAADTDILLLVDGDGTMEPGSLELLYDRYDGSAILCGREAPAGLDDSLLGFCIDLLWDLHDDICRIEPKFSTQLVAIPGDLIDRFPEDVVLDDEYIVARAREDGLDVVYVPDAIKHHHTPSDLRFYLNQRRKNWAGRFQIQDMGYEATQGIGLRTRFFLRQFASRPPREKAGMLLLAGLELVGITLALHDRWTGSWPTAWYRG